MAYFIILNSNHVNKNDRMFMQAQTQWVETSDCQQLYVKTWVKKLTCIDFAAWLSR